MRRKLAALVFLLGSCAAPQPFSSPRQPSELAGRTAGAPQRCVPIERDIGLRVDNNDRSTLLYGQGKRIWANHLARGCGFTPGDILIIQPIGSDYCRGDFVRSVDPVSHFPGSSCNLSDFIPYMR
jgi:hypothetical protein